MMNRFPITLEVLFRNLGVEGSSARIFGTNLVAGRRVSAPLVVVEHQYLGSANGLVGNSGDSLGVVREISAPVVVGQDNLGSVNVSGLVGNPGDSLGVASGGAPRSGGPTRRSGERLVVADVADPRSVGPAGRYGERLVVAGVAAPRSGGPTGRSGERLVVAGVADPRSVGPAGSSVGNHGNSLLGQDGVGSRANAMVRSSVSTDMVGISVDGHMGVPMVMRVALAFLVLMDRLILI
nr:hypothetical protein [Tanacetum cinerariifolium]